MQPRKLGKSDVLVSPVTFGAWAIGGWMWGGSDEAEAIEAIRASLDAGVNTIDTAAIYGMGYSEELVAKAIAGRPRASVVIATKCGMRWDGPDDEGSDPWAQKDRTGKDVTIRRNARPHSILYECEQSLKRLKTDYIDLYQIHWPDLTTPVEDSMGAMVKLKEQGKIRAIGVSNYNVEWLERASRVAPVASDQPPYSIITRGIERDVLPWCRSHDVGVICYSPMERGLLTGKVPADRVFPADDHRSKHKYFTPDNRRRVLDSLAKVKPIADRHGASFAQLMINWTFSEPGITAALVGARNAEQARHNAGAMGFVLTEQERAEIRTAFDETSSVMTAK
ncbi:MAG: aldo/keto reductase [Phycisphaerae bacterium]|nr:aldo/keto reductase [Tepidisphaeraceae bacterium]